MLRENAALDSFWTLFGLRGSPGPPGAGHPFGLFADSFFGVLGSKGPGDLRAWPAFCALTSGKEKKHINLSNSVLTLYGLILAPILNLFKLRFWFWELNCSFKPKICS